MEDAIVEVAKKITAEGVQANDVVFLLRSLSRKISTNPGELGVNHVSAKVQKSEDLRKNINIIVEQADKFLE